VFLAGALGLLVYLGFAGTRSSETDPADQAVSKAIMAAIDLGREGDVEGAEKALAKIVSTHPTNTDALYNYGIALAGLGKLDEADEIFTRILAVNPQDWDAIAERAGIAAERGEVDAAFDYLDRLPHDHPGLRDRLMADGRWTELAKHPRMLALREKHQFGDRLAK